MTVFVFVTASRTMGMALLYNEALHFFKLCLCMFKIQTRALAIIILNVMLSAEKNRQRQAM